MSDDNPYVSPDTSGTNDVDFDPDGEYIMFASRRQRLVGFILDELFLGFINSFIIKLSFAAAPYFTDLFNRPAEDQFMVVIFLLFFLPTFALIYRFSCEAMFGKTVGKYLQGTKVVSKDGSAPSLGQFFGRTLARLIPFEMFSILFGGLPPVAWHDSLSGTRVIEG